MASLRCPHPASDCVSLLLAHVGDESSRRIHSSIRRCPFRRIDASSRRWSLWRYCRSRLPKSKGWKSGREEKTKEGFETIAGKRICCGVFDYSDDVGPTLSGGNEAQCALRYPWAFGAYIAEQRLFPDICASPWSASDGSTKL